jgi:hypothetical protein
MHDSYPQKFVNAIINKEAVANLIIQQEAWQQQASGLNLGRDFGREL